MWWQVGQGCTLSFPPLSHAWLLASQESLHPSHPAFPHGGREGTKQAQAETVGKREASECSELVFLGQDLRLKQVWEGLA